MAEAMVAEKYFTADAALRYKYEQREKFLRDQRSREEYARAEGRAEGKAEGRAEGKAEGDKQRLLQDISNLMDSLNLTATQAMQALKLSPEEQKELLPML